MLETARERLVAFGDRAVVQSADATSLDFHDDAFDAVVSMIMLHHVGDLRGALGQCARVLRPGALMIGYDLARARPAALIHRHGHAGRDLATPDELRLVLADTGFGTIHVATGLGGLVARFSAHAPAHSLATQVAQNDSPRRPQIPQVKCGLSPAKGRPRARSNRGVRKLGTAQSSSRSGRRSQG